MNFLRKLKIVVSERSIRNRILFVLAMLIVFRFLATIPVPGVNAAAFQRLLSGNDFFGLFNLLTGGGLSTFSIVMLGVGPYITASIIMQVLTMMVPSLKEKYQENGELGRKQLSNITRLLSVPIAALQSFSFIKYLQSQGVVAQLPITALLVNILIIVAGSMLLLWIADLINEFGIGNGTSILIMAGILAQIPPKISQFFFTFSMDQLPVVLIFIAIGFLVVAGVVYIYEAERPVQITYARQARGLRSIGGNDTYLPLRLTQAGVMPIIFASSILLFPQFISGLFATSTNGILLSVSRGLTAFIQNLWLYGIVYFLLVVFFTYFYTAVTFDPHQIATNLQKNGAFIPGTRPGEATESQLGTIVARITLVGSVFLGIIAVLPIVVQSVTGITAFAVGGTSLLITISVIIDLIRRLDAQVAMHEY
jgi:preprotein translocase subunit SecY